MSKKIKVSESNLEEDDYSIKIKGDDEWIYGWHYSKADDYQDAAFSHENGMTIDAEDVDEAIKSQDVQDHLNSL